MFGIIRRIIKDKKVAFIGYSIGALVTIEMYVALFPTIRDQAEELNKLLEAYPKGFMEAFGFTSTEALFTKLEAFMSTEYFSLFWPIMVITMMVSFANLMIVTEVERGTIELTLAQPVSRMKLFFSRYLAGALYLLAFSFLSIYAIVPFAKLHGISYELANYSTMFFLSYLFGMTVFGIGLLFSSLFSEKGRASAITAGILLSMYVVNIISSLKDNLADLKYASLFHYYNPATIFVENKTVEYSIPVFLGAITVLTLVSAIIFRQRDITT